MQNYSTLYEFSVFWFHGNFILAVLVIIAYLLIFTQIISTIAARISVAIALSLVCWFVAVAASQQWETAASIADGRLSFVEGVVRNVSQQCRDGGQEFSIDSTRFPVNCGFGPGFVPGMPWTTPVRDGMHARVTYFDASWGRRIIVRFEIRRLQR
jgi:hypothetical protein